MFETSSIPFHGQIDEIRLVTEDSTSSTYLITFSGESSLDSCCATINEKICWAPQPQGVCGIVMESFPLCTRVTCNGKPNFPKGQFVDSVVVRRSKSESSHFVRLSIRPPFPW